MLAKTLVAVAATVLLASCRHEPTIETQHESKTIELDKSEQSRLQLRMSVGKLNIRGGSSRLAEANFTYNVASWKPEVDYHSTGTRSDVTISQPENTNASGDTKNEWDIRLNDKVPMDISVRFGVGDAEINLGTMNLRDVNLAMGVGKVVMDLRGNPTSSYDVHITGGVGEAIVYLPKNVGIIATASGGIGDIKTEGLVERDGRYINEAQQNSPVTVRVDVKGGVGEIHLIAE
jgi:predicted membrane protein